MADKTGYIGRAPGESSVIIARQTFTPTTSTTEFTFNDGYNVGYLDAYLNGSKLIEGLDYDANDGSVAGLTTACLSGDVLELVAYKAYNLTDPVTSAAGNFSVGNDLTVTNDTLLSKNLDVVGIATAGMGLRIESGGLEIQAGVGTVGFLTATDVWVSGTVTATSYAGDGSALTGIAATDTIAAASLTVSGISTLTGAVQAKSTTDSTTKDTGALIVEGGVGVEKNIVAGGDVRITGNINAGIATFTSVTGDGSGLTGVANTDVVHTREITASGVSTFSGVVNANGWVSCGDSIGLGDGSTKGIYFGTDEDLSIYHDASGGNSHIENTTGYLHIKSDQFSIGAKSVGENLLIATANGSVDLYYDSSKKLETTVTGSKTTGVSSCSSHCMPTADVGGDLGSTTNRWANVYTADMQLSNEGSQNDIDGTWGKYTIQEGESDLFLINRRTGKKYKFMLEEVQ